MICNTIVFEVAMCRLFCKLLGYGVLMKLLQYVYLFKYILVKLNEILSTCLVYLF